MIRPFAAFTAGQFLQNSGDSGDKPEKPSIHAVLWLQGSGDKVGTLLYDEKLFYQSILSVLFLPFCPGQLHPNRCTPYRHALYFAGIGRVRAFPWHHITARTCERAHVVPCRARAGVCTVHLIQISAIRPRAVPVLVAMTVTRCAISIVGASGP